MTIASVILAAGLGKRMRSNLPKTLHPLLGKPIVFHALDAVLPYVDLAPVLVTGFGGEQVREELARAYGSAVTFALQAEQLGTGHAVRSAEDQLRGKADMLLVTFGDMPMLRPETIERLIQIHRETGSTLTMTSVIGDLPRGFGRVVRSSDGSVQAIVEEAVATPEQLKIREYNISAYCFDAEWMWQNLARLKPSPKGEFYITDLVAQAKAQACRVEAVVLEDPAEGLGINNRVDLSDCERALRKRINQQWMLAGVSFLDPDTTTVEMDVTIGQDTVLYPNTHLRGRTSIGENCVIGPDTTLLHTSVGDNSVIQYSTAEKATVGSHVTMGPFCHLRSGAVLMDHVHLGNFGEVKDSTLGEHTKMGHFSYIGNALIGKDVNIGAGTITCNFDGKAKHLTEIGDETFIGSDTMLVAPLKIGKRAKTAAGAVVTHDVPDETLVVGVPARPRERKD
ncbi:MAG: bifunctional UDP-N-acetylglucosamine diphosphorylase/glucosamine-1-phosphate N-acetyltransferase GlmU [Anaerolineaceae bacterium]|nr:bifunctional UDP-N-acetylglucosamine diphosphorylase/glucosamine-1-phosphate N-acetyltransferase GlmU [Anaerolineaceae bacterium]